MGDRLWGLAGIVVAIGVTVVVAHSLGVRRSPTIQSAAGRVDRALPGWASEVLGVSLLLGTTEEERVLPWWRPVAIVLTALVGLFMTGFALFCLGFLLFGERGW